MKAAKFNFTGSSFWYQQTGVDNPSLVEVQFVGIGGRDFGVIVLIDTVEFCRYKHSGSFASTNAAEYCLDAIDHYIKDGRPLGTQQAKSPGNPLKSV